MQYHASSIKDTTMKRAWEMASELFLQAKPIVRSAQDQTWEDNLDVSAFYDQNLALDWGSNVPGSGAPEKIMVAAVQAMENRGYRISEKGYRYLNDGLQAAEQQDHVLLQQHSALLRRELAEAEKDPASEYWKYRYYHTFEEYLGAVTFPERVSVRPETAAYRDQIRAGWLSQLIGGAMGTMVEGYTSANIYDTFGEVRSYLREPNTYNDDTTYELAFLDAFSKQGYAVTSEDIALSWVGLIPCGWSAEEAAIRNLKNGIFPPTSGQYRNPFNEWIGAQMRAGICGMAAPGDPKMAAELAWKDGCVSHANNGILGEVFNAVMTSLSFVEKDVRTILKTAISLIPGDSEYRSVLDFVWDSCQRNDDWRRALAECEERYRKYNWIHAYPNACCEVIALWFGEGDFDKTLRTVTMCGLDVDCNAGMVMPIVAIREGCGLIPDKYLHPAFDRLTTYMRGEMREVTLDALVEKTVRSVIRAKQERI